MNVDKQPLNDPAAPVLFFEHETASGHVLAHAHLHVEATLNSLSLEMIDLTTPMLASWAGRDDVAALLFTGAGDFRLPGQRSSSHRRFAKWPARKRI